jgi:dipeptidyl aminopeptidase/acylaminoacyl peptidase
MRIASHTRTRLHLSFAATLVAVSLSPVTGAARRLEQPAAPAAGAAPQASATPQASAASAPRPMEAADVLDWKTIVSPSLSADGKWFGYGFTPVEGDAVAIIRATDGEKTYRFTIGEVPPPAGPPRGLPPTVSFSEDGKWAAFSVYPTRKDAERLKKQKKPLQTSVRLIDLSTGAEVEYPKVRKFAFSGESASAIALHRYGPEGAGKDKPKGADLIVRDLASGHELTVGGVSEFAFDKPGRWLAWTIDAEDKIGNGIVLRDLKTGAVTPLDSGKASYEKPEFNEAGTAFAVLKGVDDKAYEDKRYAVVGVADLNDAPLRAILFDPAKDSTFPAEMTISANRAPTWTSDRTGLLFGIIEAKKKIAAAGEKDADSAKDPDAGKSGGKDATKDASKDKEAAKPDEANADEKADLVLWHWKDARLQSQQQVQEDRDKKFSYLSTYRVADKKFIRLADADLRDVTPPESGRWAFGVSRKEYELTGALEGRNYQDVYAIDLATGARKLAAKQVRWVYAQSPDSTKLLFYDDGQFRVFDAETGQSAIVTRTAPVSFVDVDDDHNVVKPPVSPVGWSADSRSVLLSDAWDIWQVPVAADGTAVNLTGNGRRDRIRYTRLAVDANEKGIDLAVPQYYTMLGDWTKKGGLARATLGKTGVEALAWDDAAYGTLLKAKRAATLAYTRETGKDFPDFYIADAALKGAHRVTDGQAQVAPYAWSPSARLIDFTSTAPGAPGSAGKKGKKMQAALYLPANYEPGRKYPTIVYIYERLTDGMHQFVQPGTAHRVNKSFYTSNGYAVLMPDISYTLNDPGMSAVWCVLPALQAAIATGIVDETRVGIQGHSWGGYQTAFLVTQTKAFKAAIAGAPLTDMVSMYSLVYKNTGGANMAIFESSQGRFRGGYLDNWDAYVRNSPIAHATNVTTPLLILHNDKDGAVDFTQGVEYYNTLRRLKKPVVLLEYVGENHGLAKPANKYDYFVRMKEFFDYHLKGAPAPAWWTDGVPRLEMDDHLKARESKPKKGPATTPAQTTASSGR